MQKKNKLKHSYYFSAKLNRWLAPITDYPLTVVEAPSGFGKTVAVREYLNQNFSETSRIYWYTCLGEPPSLAWRGICELLTAVNEEAAARLKKLGMPGMNTLRYMTTILENFSCLEETFFVIDNYQLSGCEIPRELMNAFAMHGSQRLHIIVITQQFITKHCSTTYNDNIHTVGLSAFLFAKEDVAALFRKTGHHLTEDEVYRIHKHTEGWAAAVRLHMIHYAETSCFDDSAGIDHLVEIAIWNRLTPEEKDFLLSVSPLGSFTPAQAAIMLGCETLPEPIEELLGNNALIRYCQRRNLYQMHSILMEYLRNRFYHYQPQDYQNRMLRRAGHAHIAASHYYRAARIFFTLKDYDAILSMHFQGVHLSELKEKNFSGFVSDMVKECPEETFCRHPFTMLIFAYSVMFEGHFNVFRRLCGLIGVSIEKNHADLSPDELRRLKGEFFFLSSFTAYNNIAKISEDRKTALKILGGPSSIIVNDMPWAFGGTSILSMFWRESGTLDDTLRDMDESKYDYYELAHGHGAGSESVMRAEVLFMRGEEDEAEILCHKALCEARSAKQTGICLCAELVLARIAILRGDVKGYSAAVADIRNFAKEDSSLYIMRMSELCLSGLSLSLDLTDYVASWMHSMESIKKTLYATAVPHVQVLYLKFLLLEKRYGELFGVSEFIRDRAEYTTGGIRYVMPKLLHLIFLAAAKHRTGSDQEAAEHLKEALKIALPDRIYFPFAHQWDDLNALFEILSPEERNRSVIAFCKRHARGADTVRKAVGRTKSPLTPRELEVARLAKERFSAKEIAGALYISPATVRTILSKIYTKLNIHSKSQLFSMKL